MLSSPRAHAHSKAELNSAVAAYYYLRILVVMYMHEPSEATEKAEPLSWPFATAVW